MGWRRVPARGGARRNDRLRFRAPHGAGSSAADDRGGKAGAQSSAAHARIGSVRGATKTARSDYGRRAGAIQSHSPIDGTADQRSETEGAGANSRDSHAGAETEIRRIFEALGRGKKEKRAPVECVAGG